MNTIVILDQEKRKQHSYKAQEHKRRKKIKWKEKKSWKSKYEFIVLQLHSPSNQGKQEILIVSISYFFNLIW